MNNTHQRGHRWTCTTEHGFPAHLRDAVTHALVHTEASLHRHGWDQPPLLIGVFHTSTSTETTDVQIDSGLVGPAVWHQRDATGRSGTVHPVDVLLRLAGHLAAPPLRGWLRTWLHRGGRQFVGFGFCCEGWQAPIQPGSRHGDVADAPDSDRVEVRAVTATDLHGSTWHIIRQRGDAYPQVLTSGTTADPLVSGRVVAGLHRLNRLARTY